MTERRWDRIGALTGIAFVALNLLGTVLYPPQPRVDSSAATTLRWAHEHRAGIATGMVIGFVAAALFIWFAAYLRHVLERTEGHAEALSPIVFGAGIAFAVMSALAALPSMLLVFMDGQAGGLHDTAVIRMLGDLNTVLYAPTSAMAAVFFVALGIAMVRGELVTRWVGWLAIVAAVLNAAAVPIGATFSTYHGAGWLAIGWSAFVSLLVVLLATSVEMLWKPEAVRHARPVAAFAG